VKDILDGNRWLLLIPLAGFIVMSLEGALLYYWHKKPIAYWTGGYLFDRKRSRLSKVVVGLISLLVVYTFVFVVLFAKGD